MTKIRYEKARLRQTSRFYRDGSALAGTITGGPVSLETAIAVSARRG